MKETVRTLTWETGDGKSVPVFVREIAGGDPGPTLVVVAGEHGIELNGPAGIDALCRELTPRRFRGTLLAVPVIAPVNAAYRNHTLGQPRGEPYTYEMPYNSYMKWPGDPAGDPAERLAHLVWTEVVPRADMLINFHCWQINSASCYFSSDRVAGMRELAADFGIPFYDVVSYTSPELGARSLHGKLLAAGKRAALVEMQSQWWIDPRSMARVRQGVLNTMATLGMTDDPVVRCSPQFPVGRRETLVRAPHAGLYVPLKGVEEPVAKDETLGYLLDMGTGGRTEIVSPIAGGVWANSRSGRKADVVIEDLSAYADAGDLVALVKEPVA